MEIKKKIKESISKQKKEYYQKNKHEILKRMNHYRNNNKEKIKEYYKEYHKEYYQRPKVKERYYKYLIKYVRERRKKDIKFKLILILRARFNFMLYTYSKTGKIRTSREYGIDYKAIIEHLKPFPKNIKDYHVDHIIPLRLFDFNNPEHIKIAFAPENHQWITAKQNMEKGGRLVHPDLKFSK